jgi:hypothetical protein
MCPLVSPEMRHAVAPVGIDVLNAGVRNGLRSSLGRRHPDPLNK